MSASEPASTRRTALTWGLIAVSATGAVGAAALASNEARTYTGSYDAAPLIAPVIEGTMMQNPTTTTSVPGLNGAPLRSGYGSHTKSRGS